MSPHFRGDLTGSVFGRLTVVAFDGLRDHGRYWVCRCECGNEIVRPTNQLRSGHVKSCGCLSGDTTAERNAIHGMAVTPEYNSWANAKQRCLNHKHPDYPLYGGRGITMCARWAESFEAFVADMGPRPRGTSIDRIDTDGSYEPGNCRWATQKEQVANRRMTKRITHNGKTLTLMEWAGELGIAYGNIKYRLRRGFPIDAVLSVGTVKRSLYTEAMPTRVSENL